MRLPRPQIENCCVHITHRCQERRFLLRFGLDRKCYQQRLIEASRRFSRVSLLNYVITSNHVHILAWAPQLSDISAMMHWLQGTVAQDFNRRTRREGSFWRGRFQPTLVQSGSHLARCLFYLDLNMVRAKVVSHPSDWAFGGYQELCGTRKRYRCLNQEKLREFINISAPGKFRQWYEDNLNERCRRISQEPEPFWSTAFAVGDREWLEKLSSHDEAVDEYIRPCDADSGNDSGLYALTPPQSVFKRIWRRLSNS